VGHLVTLIGVLADTHIPDRAKRLHPQILPAFRQAGVEVILHAGDISSPGVLKELERVAPVHAVKGNRDWVFLNHLPKTVVLVFHGVPLLLTHGHGGLFTYLKGHASRLLAGEDPQKKISTRLKEDFPSSRVIVFGHLHQPFNAWHGDQLLFNPGSPHFPDKENSFPSVGLLTITEKGEVTGQIININQA
jgi:putative phosphoesterase